MMDIKDLSWSKATASGLLPAIVQDEATGVVLMVGYMNEAALRATIATGLVTFFSRGKGRLWTKGETSGHVLQLVSWHGDCDQDAILIRARPKGSTCHLGTVSCFGDAPPPMLAPLGDLWRTIEHRSQEDSPASYTRQLLADGVARQAQKVGEEGVEVALAAVAGDDTQLVSEAADLIYHLLISLKGRGLSPAAVAAELARRAERRGRPAASGG